MTNLVGRMLSSEGVTPMALGILFIIIGLILGAFMRELRKTKIKIPYTPVLLAIGLFLGGMSGKLGTIGDSQELLAGIDPEGILLIFIPILVFESAFNCDWHIFKRSFYQIFLLALPGVVISFLLIAGTMKFILRYDDDDLDWYSAFTFGSIAATTDPVAVVALLKELGAPVYFSTIIEGESLLNDGTAMVFYSIFVKLAKGGEATVGDGIGQFFILIIGGVALGLAGGIILSFWLDKIMKDSTLGITITVGMAYLVFFLCEELPVQFSGILGLVTLGLYMSAFGKVKISARIEHTLHSVIGWTQYVAETLIFLLTGVIVGINIFSSDSSITGTDWWKMIVFFILNNVIRAITVSILYCLLQKGSYKLTWKEYIVMVYGGLRGSLGLALALIVSVEEEFKSGEKKRTGDLILFLMAGLATLSLLVNGTTTGLLVKKIKMVKENPARKKVFRAFLRDMNATNAENYEKLKEDNPAAICDWDTVKKLTGLNDEIIRNRLVTQSNMQKLPSRHFSMNTEELNDSEIVAECRHKMLQIFVRLVWERYEESQVTAHTADILNKAVQVSHDDISKELHMFPFLFNYYSSDRSLALLTKLSKIPLIGRFFKKLFVNHFIFIYDSSTSLIGIIDETKHYLDEVNIPEHIVQKVYAELEFDRKEAQSYLNKMEDQFIEIIRFITTKRHALKILNQQRTLLAERHQRGELESTEYDQLVQILDKRVQNLHQLVKISWEPPTFSNIISSFPLFNLLTSEQTNKLIKTSTQQVFNVGEPLFTEGKKVEAIYLLLQGEVEVVVPDRINNRKSVGHIVSFINLIVPDGISRINCVASSKVKVQALNVAVLKEIIAENPQFEEKVVRGALVYLRFMRPDKAREMMKLSEMSMKHLVKNSEIIVFKKDNKIRVPHGGFVIKGKVIKDNCEYDEYCMIPKSDEPVQAMCDGMLVKFLLSEFKRKDSSVSLIPHESDIKLKMMKEHQDNTKVHEKKRDFTVAQTKKKSQHVPKKDLSEGEIPEEGKPDDKRYDEKYVDESMHDNNVNKESFRGELLNKGASSDGAKTGHEKSGSTDKTNA